MAQYYFTVAYLPQLFYDTEKPFLNTVRFLTLCSETLHRRDILLVQKTKLTGFDQSEPINELLLNWHRFEITLRNELVNLRAHKRGKDPYEWLKEVQEVLGLSSIARDAFNQDNPLQAEDMLNRVRWKYFDDLESGHYFDVEKLQVYYLRLQLLERKALFDKEKGYSRFEKIRSEKLKSANLRLWEEGFS